MGGCKIAPFFIIITLATTLPTEALYCPDLLQSLLIIKKHFEESKI